MKHTDEIKQSYNDLEEFKKYSGWGKGWNRLNAKTPGYCPR